MLSGIIAMIVCIATYGIVTGLTNYVLPRWDHFKPIFQIQFILLTIILIVVVVISVVLGIGFIYFRY